MMNTEIFYYVKKKLESDFQKCLWEDGVGRKFADTNLVDMGEAAVRLGSAVEEAADFYNRTEKLLASVGE